MKIKTPFTLAPKYLNEFNNYFNNADETLESYTYIPEYLKKSNLKNSNTIIKNYLNNNLADTK